MKDYVDNYDIKRFTYVKEAKELVAKLNILLPANATWSYGYAKDLDFHGYGDPARWINDSEDYNALVEAGEIMPREYRQ